MKTAIVRVFGDAPYSQSRPHLDEKKNKESAQDYEARTWRSRLHTDRDGYVVIPAMAFKNCLAEAAKFLSLQIPGKGKSTYTKHFESGILLFESTQILDGKGKPIHKDDCDKEGSPIYGDWIFTPSDGVPGSGKRVYRCYPVINPPWVTDINIVIADDSITEDVLAQHLEAAGNLIGIGRWRVRNRGLFGRFHSEILSWQEPELKKAS